MRNDEVLSTLRPGVLVLSLIHISLMAVKHAKDLGALTLSICNTQGCLLYTSRCV